MHTRIWFSLHQYSTEREVNTTPTTMKRAKMAWPVRQMTMVLQVLSESLYLTFIVKSTILQ